MVVVGVVVVVVVGVGVAVGVVVAVAVGVVVVVGVGVAVAVAVGVVVVVGVGAIVGNFNGGKPSTLTSQIIKPRKPRVSLVIRPGGSQRGGENGNIKGHGA